MQGSLTALRTRLQRHHKTAGAAVVPAASTASPALAASSTSTATSTARKKSGVATDDDPQRPPPWNAEKEYVVVVDFEATCLEPREPDFQSEIIEFPAILLRSDTMAEVRRAHGEASDGVVSLTSRPSLFNPMCCRWTASTRMCAPS